MEKKPIKSKAHWLVYPAFAVFYVWMAAQIPYTHDDWGWGSDTGIQWLLTASVNSRYAGNFFVVAMTRSELVKNLIMGTVCTLLPLAAAAVALKGEPAGGKRRLILFLGANFLLLTIDREIWRQTFGWVSGYANYVISALVMLVCVYICLPGKKRQGPAACAGAFLLGVAVQLFLENLSLYMVLLFLCVGIAEYVRTKKVSKTTAFLLLGAVVGLVIMFSSNIYSTLWTEGKAVGGYRKLNIQPGKGLGKTLFDLAYRAAVILIRLFEYNLAISLAVLVLVGLLLVRRPGKLHIAGAAINGALCVYFVYNRVSGATPNVWIEAMVNGLFFLLIAGEAVVLFGDERPRLFKLLAAWVSGPIVIAPIIITTELGERLFLTSNIFLILVVLMLLDTLLRDMSEKACRSAVLCGIAAVAAAAAFWVGIYVPIGACKIQREAVIAEAAETGADTVILPGYPHEEYLWGPDPGDKTRKTDFRTFYSLGSDVEFVVEDAPSAG